MTNHLPQATNELNAFLKKWVKRQTELAKRNESYRAHLVLGAPINCGANPDAMGQHSVVYAASPEHALLQVLITKRMDFTMFQSVYSGKTVNYAEWYERCMEDTGEDFCTVEDFVTQFLVPAYYTSAADYVEDNFAIPI